VTRAVLSCSYLVEEVRRAMGDGSRWGLRLDYAVEDEPLGTAGGVRNAAALVAGRVVVLNGDILTDADLGAMLRFHAERGARASIYLTPVEDTGPYGLVEVDGEGRVQRFVEKPPESERTVNTINAGIYVLDADLLGRIPPATVMSMEREFFPGLLRDRVPFVGWVARAYWMDIGNTQTYRQAQLDLLAGRVDTDIAPAGMGGDGRWVGEGVTLGARVAASAPVVIGAGSRLADDCRVGPATVLGADCQIGSDAVVTGAVLWERVSVGAGAVLRDCIVGAAVRIGPHAQVGPGMVLADGSVVAPRANLAR
jgi:mannose-1-phosphate guanylyltransferase